MSAPMYRQIAENLRRKIESGEVARGSQLPTEQELMTAYGASRNTVRDAIKWLTTRGLVETRPGQGTFAVEKIVPLVITLTGAPDTGESVVYDAAVRRGRRNPSSSKPRIEIQPAAGQIAEGLGLANGTSVISRHQQYFIDDTPWSMQTSFYPMSLAERGATRLLQAENITQGAVRYIADKLGIKQVGYRDQIKVRPPDTNEALFFGLADDGRVSVFAILRTAFDQVGEAVRLTITVYPADRNQFLVDVGEVPPAIRDAAGDERDISGAMT